MKSERIDSFAGLFEALSHHAVSESARAAICVKVVDRIESVYGFDRVNLLLYRHEGNFMEAVASTGHPRRRTQPFCVPVLDRNGNGFRSVASRAFLRGETIVVSNRDDDPEFQARGAFPHKQYSGAFAVFPLVHEDDRLGILSVGFEAESAREFRADEVSDLTFIACELGRCLGRTSRPREDVASFDQYLCEIIRGRLFEIHYQPVVNIRDSSIAGYEALTRSKHPVLYDPTALFELAVQFHRYRDLAYFTHLLALSALPNLAAGQKLLLNFHPDDFSEYLMMEKNSPFAAADLHSIVFEITERDLIESDGALPHLIDLFRRNGAAIAIDDLGSGYSSLDLLATVEPEYVKFDISLVRGIGRNFRRRELLRSLLRYADKIGCRSVAEGVECEADFEMLCRIGGDLAQGYFLGYPAPWSECSGQEVITTGLLSASCLN